MTTDRFATFSLGVLLAFVAGCSGPAARPCPVAGKVLAHGKPAEGVYVVFHAIGKPELQSSPGSARTMSDGSFTGNVPVAGEYAVTVFWPSTTVDQGEVIEGPDRLKGRYRNPEKPLLKVTITDGDNVLSPITLAAP